MWLAAVTGALGWLLLASAVGKATDANDFREGLERGRLVPQRLVAPLAVALPTLELACGLAVLFHPASADLACAGALYGVFAAYQAEVLQRGGDADCRCYGRLRSVAPGPAAVLGNALLSTAAVALAVHPAAGHAGVRLLVGAAAAVAYLGVLGRAAPPAGMSGYPYAEVCYLEARRAGRPDAQAREAVAAAFGLDVSASYLLVPRARAWRLGLRARWSRGRRSGEPPRP